MNMIEVEKKFLLSDQDKEQLIEDAEFLNERTFTDVYYDTADFTLTSQDKWLRSREGRFELKLPLHHGTDRLADQFDELEDDFSIKQSLGFVSEGSLSYDLTNNGYQPFATLTTTRRKYKKGDFIIDLDVIDFGSSTYAIGEIEMMVPDKSEIEGAVLRIIQFAQEQGLTIAPVRGKIIEYLNRINPEHYKALVEAGVVKDF